MKIIKPLLTVFILGLLVFGFYSWVVFPLLADKAEVVHVIDADSLIVMEKGELKNVQLVGVNAPENMECYSEEATSSAAAYFGKKRKVVLEIDEKLGEKDLYLRDLRYIKLEDGSLMNEKLLEDGLAKEFHPDDSEYALMDRFAKAESKARDEKVGLWEFCV